MNTFGVWSYIITGIAVAVAVVILYIYDSSRKKVESTRIEYDIQDDQAS